MSDGVEQLEQASEEHRARIATLVDELRDRVTPGEIVNQLIGRDAGQALAGMLTYQARRQLRENPVPVGIIGIGLAWLLLANAMHNRRQIPLHDGLDYEDFVELQDSESTGILSGARRVVRQLSDAAGHRVQSLAHLHQEAQMTHHGSHKNGSGLNGNPAHNGSGTGVKTGEGAPQKEVNEGDARDGLVGRFTTTAMEKAKIVAGRTQEAATGLAHTALQKSGDALNGAKDAASTAANSLMERTNDMARRTGRAASNTASRAGTGIGSLAREQPLLVAGVGFALGVALGALLPLSRMENEMLGEQAERLKEGAKEMANEGYEKVKSVAQRTYEAATETLKGASEDQSSSSSSTTSPGTTGTTSGKDNAADTGSNAYRH